MACAQAPPPPAPAAAAHGTGAAPPWGVSSPGAMFPTNPGNRNMSTSDIDGAQPKRHTAERHNVQAVGAHLPAPPHKLPLPPVRLFTTSGCTTLLTTPPLPVTPTAATQTPHHRQQRPADPGMSPTRTTRVRAVPHFDSLCVDDIPGTRGGLAHMPRPRAQPLNPLDPAYQWLPVKEVGWPGTGGGTGATYRCYSRSVLSLNPTGKQPWVAWWRGMSRAASARAPPSARGGGGRCHALGLALWSQAVRWGRHPGAGGGAAAQVSEGHPGCEGHHGLQGEALLLLPRLTPAALRCGDKCGKQGETPLRGVWCRLFTT